MLAYFTNNSNVILFYYAEVENQYMNSYRTRGRFGFNYAQSKFAFQQPTLETNTPKRRRVGDPESDLVEYAGPSVLGSAPKYVKCT